MKQKSFLMWAGLAALGLGHLQVLHAQRAAAAWAAVDANGVVTHITVSHGGTGYLAAPAVVIGGGGGSNAAARASVVNGSVAAIQILSGGAGYTNAPSVGIDPPEALVTVLGLGRGAALTLAGEIGSTQEVQAVETLGGGQAWTPVKSAVLTNGLWSFQDPNATPGGQRFYRAVARGGARPATPEGMVWLPPGSFLMGSPQADPDYIANEGPQGEVRLTQGFFLGRREVSQGDYLSLMGTNPATFTGESNRPVETVSWGDATNYCAKLTQREQAAGRIPATWRYRLPTEAEWEYAARAGGTDRFGISEALAGGYAWQGENSLETTHPAGGQRPNGWGLYDLAGNVAEWCADAYGDYPGAVVVDPLGATQGQARVVRGASYLAPLALCRAGARDARSGADYRDAWVGFRVALAHGRAEAMVDPAAVGGTISGQVTIQGTNVPLAGVAVYLVDANFLVDTNNEPASPPVWVAATVTGPDGRYVFSNVKPGGYGVLAMKTENGAAWQVAAAEASASTFLTVSNDQRSFNFSAEDRSLIEGGQEGGMVWINPGTFKMGSPATELDRSSIEGPQTVVTITKGFWMSKYETTQAEYQAVMGSNPSAFKGDPQRPVERVTWSDATNYCGKLTVRERLAGRLPAGYEYRLPTEAEWEYACRAGTTTPFSYGDGSSPGYTILKSYAWYYDNSGSQTHPVGQKLPNAWGLYDMHGNVWEWCQDWWKDSLPGGSVSDPRGPTTGSNRVSRGGGWADGGRFCRSAYRYGGILDFRSYFQGFRPVLSPGQ